MIEFKAQLEESMSKPVHSGIPNPGSDNNDIPTPNPKRAKIADV